MDPTGETETQQLPGAACSLPSIEELPTVQEKFEHSPTDQQCDSNRLSKLSGWYPFSGTLRSSSENLGMVHREGDCYSHRTPPRQGECQSGLGVSACEGLQRLDARERHLSPARVQVGPVLHRPMRHRQTHSSLYTAAGAQTLPWRIITHMCSHHLP